MNRSRKTRQRKEYKGSQQKFKEGWRDLKVVVLFMIIASVLFVSMYWQKISDWFILNF